MGVSFGLPPLPLPLLPIPGLPSPFIAPPPSGVTFAYPGSTTNQPGLPSSASLSASAYTIFNSIAAQLFTNPVALITAPLAVPVMIGQQYAAKTQAGSVQARTTNVTLPASGAWIQLQPTPTNILEGQLYNPQASGIALSTAAIGASTADPGSIIPVAAGGTFNFGPIDLSTIFVSNNSNNNPVKVVLYIEQ